MPPLGRRGLFLAALLGASAALAAPSPPDLKVRLEEGQAVRLASFAGREKPCVLIFVATACPASALAWDRIKGVWYNHRDAGVRMALVGGNSDDSPAELRALLKRDPSGLDLPLLWDPGHELATALGVDSTPVAVVLSPTGAVLYRGPIDDNWRNGARAQAHWLDDAVREALQGRASPARDRHGFTGSRMR